MKNFYQILSVSENAGLEEIKAAYRKLARRYHPDVAKTPEAEEHFKEINRAYEVLSDSLKRSDYDQSIKQNYGKKETPSTTLNKSELMASFSRIAAYAVSFAAVAMFFEWFAWWLAFSGEKSFSLVTLLPGLILGILLGGFWGADMNFKVETFLGAGALGRTYTFFRTIIMAISIGYFLGILGMLLDKFFYGSTNWLTFVFFIMGIIIGSTAGSDGDTIEKINSTTGRFNLFYTALRGIEVGAVVGLAGFVIGLMIVKFGGPSAFVAWGAFFGFVLGDIIGSIAPPNLAAYASYASAYVTKIIVFLMVGGALIVGIFIGTTLSDEISRLFSSLWQGIVGLF